MKRTYQHLQDRNSDTVGEPRFVATTGALPVEDDLWDAETELAPFSVDGDRSRMDRDLDRENEQLSQQLKAALRRLQKANEENHFLQQLVTSLEQDQSSIRTKLAETQADMQKSSEEARRLSEEVKTATTLAEQFSAERKSVAIQLRQRFEAELQQVTARFKRQVETSTGVHESEKAHLTQAIDQYRHQVRQLRAELADSQHLVHLWKNESTNQRNLVGEYQRVNQSLSETIRTMAGRAVNPAETAAQHRKSVSNEEMLQTVRTCQELSTELHLLSETHPLAEYLSVMQSKLQQMERELVRVPYGHPERPQMESTVHELMDQRDRLRPMLAEGRSRLQRGAEKLRDAGSQILRSVKG